jgi:hypothetical protein
MDVTEDGSPVEVYRRLPENGETALVASVVAPGSSILELGSGAGRGRARGARIRGHRGRRLG